LSRNKNIYKNGHVKQIISYICKKYFSRVNDKRDTEDKHQISTDFKNNFDRIYVDYYPRMLRFAKEYVIFEEDAENIVQDIFMILWEKRAFLNVEVSLTTYLFALVKNKCLNYLQHKRVASEFQAEMALKLSALEKLDETFSSEEEIEQIIRAAIDRLPPHCRDIFIKSRMEGKRYVEIANEMNISVNTVENQISIALRKLRVDLKDYLPLLLFLIGF
jgi:RNA polymerase sigma-70 factor (family 1)